MSRNLVFTKSVDGSGLFDILEHQNIHTKLLLEKFPNLKVYDNVQKVVYYSATINSQADQFNLLEELASSYVKFYSIEAYKNIKIDCHKCSEEIKVYSYPPSVPVIVEHETYTPGTPTEYFWYSLNYEDFIKTHSFGAATLEAAKLKIIDALNTRTSNKQKVDLFYLDSKIKKLLPFV